MAQEKASHPSLLKTVGLYSGPLIFAAYIFDLN